MKPVDYLSVEVTEHMCPVIRDFFINVYENPDTFLEPDQKEPQSSLIKFQLALKKVPNWTNTQIKKHIDEITNHCNWFKQLLIGLFVAHVKMISDGIRTSSKSRRLNVKLPSDETFVHTCFVTCAHNLYEDPFIMKEPEKKRQEELDKRMHDCVMKSIRKLLPLREILNEHIPVTNDSVCFNDHDEEPSSNQTDILPPPSSNEETGEPASVPLPSEPSTLENKQIPISPVSEKPDLFPDAPDEKDDDDSHDIEEEK